ncbi:MAG TPA: Lrp/AsnC ligand binding domain-containing protein [Nitrososphaera sp.]|jgi:DNA-binding Lrp family transcriptional regulator|nr:Lrp/AsnC ligand binding domain-containing protein [Nitrososphaera sp.]
MIGAFVVVNCHFPFDTRIMDEISKIPSVTHLYRTEGRYDLMVKIKAETKDMLVDMISRDVNAIHGVDATLTMIIA